MKHVLTSISLLIATCLPAQYRIFSYDAGNLYAQRMLPLKDGNILLLAEIDCYTPGAITIEGCHYALQLIKITPTGDTIWTNTFPYSAYNICLLYTSDAA